MGFTGLFGKKTSTVSSGSESSYDDGWGNIVSDNKSTNAINNPVTNNSNNQKSNFMGVASGIVTGLGAISGSVADILTSGDKIEIAKYQAQGEIAKANAIIAEAQAKADAQAEADKAKSKTTTYIVIGAGIFLIIIIIVVVLLSKKSPSQGIPYYPQYQIQKPIMPTNYVQSASPPRQLQPVAVKA